MLTRKNKLGNPDIKYIDSITKYSDDNVNLTNSIKKEFDSNFDLNNYSIEKNDAGGLERKIYLNRYIQCYKSVFSYIVCINKNVNIVSIIQSANLYNIPSNRPSHVRSADKLKELALESDGNIDSNIHIKKQEVEYIYSTVKSN